MARLRFFAQARDAAGCRSAEIDAATVREALGAAVTQFGDGLGRVIAISAIWVNGEPAEPDSPLGAGDELAILPPVSGGSGCGAGGSAAGRSGAGEGT